MKSKERGDAMKPGLCEGKSNDPKGNDTKRKRS